MSEADGEDTKRDDELELDEDRAAILQRRRKFVTAALGGIAMATTVLADCSTPEPCLRMAQPTDVPTMDAADSQPQPCLSPVADVPTQDSVDAADSQPQPCLSPVLDVPTVDVPPQPCLSPVLDVPDVDAEPQPCLRMAPPVDGG